MVIEATVGSCFTFLGDFAMAKQGNTRTIKANFKPRLRIEDCYANKVAVFIHYKQNMLALALLLQAKPAL